MTRDNPNAYSQFTRTPTVTAKPREILTTTRLTQGELRALRAYRQAKAQIPPTYDESRIEVLILALPLSREFLRDHPDQVAETFARQAAEMVLRAGGV